MCKLVDLEIDGKVVKVADIKKECIINIVNSIDLCKQIDKVMLFGSAIEDRCIEFSDIDIAVFGSYSKYRMLRLKSYKDFLCSIYRFNDFKQDYDVLYFDSLKDNTSRLTTNIINGVTLYERK